MASGQSSAGSPSGAGVAALAKTLSGRVAEHAAETAALAGELASLAAGLAAGGAQGGAAHVDDASGSGAPLGAVLPLLSSADALHAVIVANVRAGGDAAALQLQAAAAVPLASARPSAAAAVQPPPVPNSAGGGSVFDAASAPALTPFWARIREWGWPVFEVAQLAPPGAILRLTAWACLQDLGLVAALGLNPASVQGWLSAVEAHYHHNPYHNPVHVADVTQTTHYFLTSGRLAEWLPPARQLAMLLAAVAHDVGHPGVNNGFLVNSRHPLAVVYNDASPLENMHAALAFQLAGAPGCNPLEGLSPEDAKAVRGDMIHCILGTDNASHFGNLGLLKGALEKAAEGGGDAVAPGALAAASPQLLMQQVLHMADVSNPAKPWDVYMGFTERLVYEYYALGDCERSAGLPVTPMLDRTAPIPMPDFQLGFLNFIVLPLFSSVASVPGLDIAAPLAQLKANIAEWERRKAASAAAASAAEQ